MRYTQRNVNQRVRLYLLVSDCILVHVSCGGQSPAFAVQVSQAQASRIEIDSEKRTKQTRSRLLMNDCS